MILQVPPGSGERKGEPGVKEREIALERARRRKKKEKGERMGETEDLF